MTGYASCSCTPTARCAFCVAKSYAYEEARELRVVYGVPGERIEFKSLRRAELPPKRNRHERRRAAALARGRA